MVYEGDDGGHAMLQAVVAKKSEAFVSARVGI
jgi:hypothetical protein